jgi:hypothetical protein
VEAARAIASLKALSDNKDYPIDLHFNGGITMSSPDEKGTVSIPADIEGGEVKVRIAGGYLNEALRACGGMADFKVTNSPSPVLFTVEGYQLFVMPMFDGDGNTAAAETPETEQSETEAETPDTGQVEAEPETEQAETLAEPETPETETAGVVAEAEKIVKAGKPKRSRRKEPVAV